MRVVFEVRGVGDVEQETDRPAFVLQALSDVGEGFVEFDDGRVYPWADVLSVRVPEGQEPIG